MMPRERIAREEAQTIAARAMLAALKAIRLAIITDRLIFSPALPVVQRAMITDPLNVAIAAAEDVGITTDRACPVCNGLGANPVNGEDCAACYGGGAQVED